MMQRPRIKICGIKQVEEATAAVSAGADAIGLVFYPSSCRYVNVQKAEQIAQVIPPFISLAGLFVNHDMAYITMVHQRLKLSVLQFHGDESPEFCMTASRQLSLPFIKAVRVDATDTIMQSCQLYHAAQGLLLDRYDAAHSGGTGRTFDWRMIPKKCDLPIVLAGGLHSGNVTQALDQVQPYAVDVSSGVEEKRGVKSIEKIQAFITQVYQHTCHRIHIH